MKKSGLQKRLVARENLRHAQKNRRQSALNAIIELELSDFRFVCELLLPTLTPCNTLYTVETVFKKNGLKMALLYALITVFHRCLYHSDPFCNRCLFNCFAISLFLSLFVSYSLITWNSCVRVALMDSLCCVCIKRFCIISQTVSCPWMFVICSFHHHWNRLFISTRRRCLLRWPVSLWRFDIQTPTRPL